MTSDFCLKSSALQATACGLSQDAIESALSKRSTTSGLTVRRNSDEDTVRVCERPDDDVDGRMCVSRYDAFLYTHATANRHQAASARAGR